MLPVRSTASPQCVCTEFCSSDGSASAHSVLGTGPDECTGAHARLQWMAALGGATGFNRVRPQRPVPCTNDIPSAIGSLFLPFRSHPRYPRLRHLPPPALFLGSLRALGTARSHRSAPPRLRVLFLSTSHQRILPRQTSTLPRFSRRPSVSIAAICLTSRWPASPQTFWPPRFLPSSCLPLCLRPSSHIDHRPPAAYSKASRCYAGLGTVVLPPPALRLLSRRAQVSPTKTTTTVPPLIRPRTRRISTRCTHVRRRGCLSVSEWRAILAIRYNPSPPWPRRLNANLDHVSSPPRSPTSATTMCSSLSRMSSR